MKAQAAMEYLLVAALILIVVIPATYLFFNYSQRSSGQIKEGRVTKMGSDIVNNAETIYYLGEPSRIVLTETMPEGVDELRIDSDWEQGVNELVFVTRFAGGEASDFVFSSKVNLQEAGDVLGEFDELDRRPGTKKIRLEAKNGPPPYVLVNIT